MATTKMPVLSMRTDLEDMPVLSAKQPGTQKASPAAAPKVGGDISAETWTRETPAQTKVPQRAKQGSSLLTKTENVAVGGSRGGRTVYRDVEMPTLAGRAVKVASSVGKSAASTFSDASRALYEAGQKGRTARDTELQGDIQTRLERAESDLSMMLEDNLKQPGTWTDQEVQSQRYVVEDAQRKVNALRQVSEGQVQQKATQKVNQLVDSLDESAAKDTQEAKRGLGKTGSAVVDIGTAGLQLAADRAVGTAMGIGTMPVVAMRVFGGGTKEARQSGATLGQQLTYGAASAAVSAATEQLSNVVKPFAKAFGAGVTDDVVEAAIGKAVERFAGTPAGKTALEGVLKSGAGFLGEGLEEFAEDVASPILKRMTYDPSAQFDLQEALYDFLIGGALGGLGGAWEGVTDAGGRYRGYQTRAAEAAVDSAYDTMREKGMFSQEARRAVRDAEDIMPKLYRGVTETELDRISPRLTDENGNWYDEEGREHSAGEQNRQASTSMGQETSMEDAAFESKTVPDHLGAVALLQKNLGDISSMQPVSVVTGQEVPKTGIATERAMAFLKNIGGKVERPGFGEVLFSKSKVKNSLLGHGFGEAKVELMAGVPGVIQHGKQIGFTENWKGRGYDSYVFAAPVQYRGENVYVTAIVIKDSANRYYLHEAVDQNGNMIFGQNKSSATASDGPAAKPQDTVAGSELSGNSIPQHQGKNNGKFEEPDIMPKLTAVQEPPEGKEPTVDDLSRQAAGAGPNTVPQKPRQQNKNAMDTLGIQPVDDLADYSNTEYLRGSDEAKKVTTKARRQAEARLQPTRSEKKFAKGIAAGDYTVEDIPASMSRATVTELADYYAAENSFKSVDGVQERGRQIREKTERLAAELFKGEGSFKPISMLKMNERTPERVMRSIFGDRQGEIINENYIYPVQQNEAGKMRFIQRQLDAVRTFEDSHGQRSELTKVERAIVQQIMEDRFVEETVASMEVAQGIRNAAENIRKGEDPIDAGREFSLDAEERALAQQLARWTQNQEWLRSGELDSVKINNAVQKYAEQYDLFYDAVNDFLTAHGYGTIGFIKGYAPHMQGVDTQNKLLSALRSMGVNTDASNLPTSISGLTADYKPGKRWNPFFQSRVGNKTDYDVAKGYESYVSYLGDIFYHTDDIARLRGVSRYLRKTYGPEEIKNAIDHAESLRNTDLNTQTEVLKNAGKITDGTKLTYQDARKLMDEYIDELYDNVTKVTKFGEFVKYIDNYANLLAGKQSMADRGMEYMAGRTSLNAGNKLVAAFGRAQVAGNVSSVLNQSSQLAQIAAEVDGKYIAKAAADLAKATKGKLWNIKETKLFDQSDLLTGKKGIEYLTADDSKFDRMVSAMFKPADIMDSMVSALAVQSKYNQLVAEGTPSEVAMLEADRWATQIMASRMKGSRPMAFESKNVVNQMLHMFQVEAMNSWEHLRRDLPYKYRNIEKTHGKKAVTRAVATVITKGLVSAFLLNRAAEAVYGGTPAPFDVLGYIANFVSSGFGMTANEGLKRLVNAGWKALFGENLLGDDDEDKELKPFDWGAAAKDLRYDVYNDIPFARNAAGLLGLGDQTMPFTNMAEAGKGVWNALKAEEKSAGEIGESFLKLGSTLIPGARQIQKTYQGTKTMLQGGRTYGHGDKQRMQYPVEQSPGKWAQAVLFGNSGLSETREFYASGDSGLTAKQTRTVQQMAAEGSDRTKVYETIQNLRRKDQKTGAAPDKREKMVRLNDADLSDEEKLRIYQETIATSESKRPETFRQLMDMGMNWAQVSEAYIMYLDLDSNDNMPAGEKATRFARWADGQGLTSDQRAALKDSMAFYSQAKAEAGRYTAMTEAGLDPGKAESLTMRISQLRPEAGKETVRDLQRYEVVTSDRSLSEAEQLAALESMMEDTEFEKLETAYAAGVTPGQYVEFKRVTDGLSADKINGKTVSGSKKAKVLAAIDAMDITNSQKTALYYAAGYKESTLDDAPWISGGNTVRSREEAIKLLQGANSQPQDLTMPRLTDENGEVWNPFAKKSSDITMPRLVK